VRKALACEVVIIFLFGTMPDLLIVTSKGLLLTVAVIAVISLSRRMVPSMGKNFFKWLFSKWFFRLYFGSSAVFLIVFPIVVPATSIRTAVFDTLGLMSGSDPFAFKSEIENHLGLWVIAWLIHVASWLLIPALIALVVAEARDEIKKTQSLDDGFAALARDAGVTGSEIRNTVKELNDGVETLLTEIRQRGERL
jgi:hypothetical protein